MLKISQNLWINRNLDVVTSDVTTVEWTLRGKNVEGEKLSAINSLKLRS